MASLLPEISGIKRGSDDEFQGFEASEINGALLMSLLEEPQGYHENDEERLQSVIQSLEAEINPDVGIKSELLLAIEGDEHICMNELEGGDNNCFAHNFGYWVDIKQLMPSSPSDDIEVNWYMDTPEIDDQLDMDIIGIIHEFGAVRDYSQIHLDEPAGDSSLWQHTYDITQ